MASEVTRHVRETWNDPEVQRAAAALRVTTDRKLGKKSTVRVRQLAGPVATTKVKRAG